MNANEIYDLSMNLRFIRETKDGNYAEIEKVAMETPRLSETIEYIDAEEKDYYYSFDF